jgi:uncharacterized protein (TIGR00288 family)
MDTIAVFVDGDNINSRDMPYIMDEIKSFGRVVSSRIYTDWSADDSKNWKKIAIELALEPIHCDRVSGKNSTDIKLTVDLMRILYTVPSINLFYIVTSDGDYRHLIPEIKLANKKVHVIGSNISKSLQSCCDVSTKIEVLRMNNKQVGNSEEIEEKLYSVLDKLIGEDEMVQLSVVKDTLQRKYGFNRFSKFVKKYLRDLYTIQYIDSACYIASK